MRSSKLAGRTGEIRNATSFQPCRVPPAFAASLLLSISMVCRSPAHAIAGSLKPVR
jgi:hypothetical protein